MFHVEHSEEEWPSNSGYLVPALRQLATDIAGHELSTDEAAARLTALTDWLTTLLTPSPGNGGWVSSPTENVPRETSADPGGGGVVYHQLEEPSRAGSTPALAPGEPDAQGERRRRAEQQVRAFSVAHRGALASSFPRKRGRFRGKLRRRKR